jgi:hypothetical protein
MLKGEVDLRRLFEVEGEERVIRALTEFVWDRYITAASPTERQLMGFVYEHLADARAQLETDAGGMTSEDVRNAGVVRYGSVCYSAEEWEKMGG